MKMKKTRPMTTFRYWLNTTVPLHMLQWVMPMRKMLLGKAMLRKIQRMLQDHKTDLYPDCKEGLKKLGSTLELLQWKAANGVTDKGFEELLKLVKKILPEGNKLPSTTYQAKHVVCPLGL